MLLPLLLSAVPHAVRAQATGTTSTVTAPTEARAALAGTRGGRLSGADIGLVINTADPYSVRVGEHYARARGLTPQQVLHIELPVRAALTREEFAAFEAALQGAFGAPRQSRVQALALAWRTPYAVECMSIGGALALGVDALDCRRSCGRSTASPYFNSASARPARELGLWPSMLLAADSTDAALALIDRGVAADRGLGRRGAPPVEALLLSSRDAARNARAALYPPAGAIRGTGVDIHLATVDAALPAAGPASEAGGAEPLEPVLLVQVGMARLPPLASLRFVRGALADHLTSYGGRLDDARGQSSALEWIQAGATATHGTVSEPCNHLQKFPHPQVLLLHYLRGETAIEAYWKSVAWPAQSLFIGEPLAAPFARD
ncbi:uncharacterized protein (TIGR03790 family) [Rivibacter subsaxonicus]|uniref:Uncharacterized protein (TIGR03790 family) n=1 Tax=Rivibacter subsaxonicus TaxID=457575 RepID=A0A4V2FUR5_9BURK|nr:uncharacterized protein (TIGR03790 family) [Rivibacter subsaxonicus]